MDAIVLQCGGPTAVINASLWGVIEGCRQWPQINRLWGARHGLRGLIKGDWTNLTTYVNREPGLEFQPGAALGSSRDWLGDEDVPELLEQLENKGIDLVFIIGGNGSMQAAYKLHRFAGQRPHRVRGLTLQVIGIPKTIDNDLVGTDFAPGYGSAASYVARTTRDVGLDLITMQGFDDVAVLEIMGRHAGWLTAAAALARSEGTANNPPHLILLPEVPFTEANFLQAVRQNHAQNGVCLVVAAEGVRDQAGVFLAEKQKPLAKDASGQKLLSFAAGLTPYLAGLVQQKLGLRCRQLRPDTIQRSSSALASRVDRECAARVGRAAVEAAREGLSGVMIGLDRQPEGWQCGPVALEAVTGQEKPLPAAFISGEFDVSADFAAYARPLIDDWQPETAVLF
ncbi:MAG: diphosphate--fructose-6-phosphate 1-phosphotransferase [Chloroflexi bacterium]|nr:diphosphate--fructose-6-phosphate 1-phosphotransferase [Chloroflexota bacterium]OJV95322.1 MAG: hypothetical protein BGO39_25330 [Chloroflexi bacterium 54-19]